MMTGNITHSLLKTIDEYSEYILQIDDFFITGVIAEKAGIKRYNTSLISDECHPSHVFPIHTKITIFNCGDYSQALSVWSEFKVTPEEDCIKFKTLSVLIWILYTIIVTLLFVYIILKERRRLSRVLKSLNICFL